MKQRTAGKILIDAAMTLLYILLMIDFGSETFFHEAAGILVGALFLAHLILNRRALTALWRKSVTKHAGIGTRLQLALDLLLPIVMLVDMGTGVLIARSLFSLNVDYSWQLVYGIHTAASWTGLALLAAHAVFHAKYLAAVIPALIRNRRSRPVFQSLRRAAALLLMLAAVYCATYSVYARARTVSDAAADAQDAALSESGTHDTARAKRRSERDKGSGGTQPGQTNPSDDDTGESDETPVAGDTPPTLDAYLSALTCTGCARHCLLINPHCSKGVAQQEAATAEYEAAYGDA